MKYRKKPVVIDAAQYTGPNAFDVGRELGMEFGQPPHEKEMPELAREMGGIGRFF